LNGQQPGYVLKALNDYSNGARSGNAQQKIMIEVASLMNDKEKAAVAAYVRGLQ
jgi:cytochrome c553